MRRPRLLCVVFGVFTCAAAASMATPAQAQNDWQYPDPYFGILEIEKSHNDSTARRYRAEVNPAPRSSKAATATPAPVAPAPVTRNRWRNRWRRQ